MIDLFIDKQDSFARKHMLYNLAMKSTGTANMKHAILSMKYWFCMDSKLHLL